ncbi:unnamed protein product [Polarella glacialis]|uniref:Uncharacterized protein n=2 Tax=Polarella glacialis TaxID=89957 RepID=A0A813FS67_POLGL|nr:unnamed protein product [Polarella glacialis]
MRAISNIKVKLGNHAPPPDEEELEAYREAVREHLDTIRASLQCQVRTDALLPPSAFNSFKSELGLSPIGNGFSVDLAAGSGVADTFQSPGGVKSPDWLDSPSQEIPSEAEVIKDSVIKDQEVVTVDGIELEMIGEGL